MKQTDNKTFLATLRNGDIGLIQSDNLFARLQALYAHRFNEGPYLASHGFFMKTPPLISEANGIIINGGATILKDVGDSTKCWIFRYTKLTPPQLSAMNVYALGAEQTGGHYSIWGICQFAKAFLTGKRIQKEESGVFCSEYTSRIIEAGEIADYITEIPVWEIDPTYQLNWFLTEGLTKGWILKAQYDGSNYFVNDALEEAA